MKRLGERCGGEHCFKYRKAETRLAIWKHPSWNVVGLTMPKSARRVLSGSSLHFRELQFKRTHWGFLGASLSKT